ncbi:MAG TPA: helix-turn-helix domain-containing protein [Gemmatimonadaceae bacterium]|jgi:AraC-like DNA-binding protein|nr:helix-turn-helix domain-containing protein [Gemmatimonadaceae bacterium]
MVRQRPIQSGIPRRDRPDPWVVGWVPLGPEQERSLHAALGTQLDLELCRTEQELWEALARPHIGVLVVELGVGGHPSPASLTASVHERHPAIRILGHGWLSQALAADILACARVGLDALALRGYADLALEIRRLTTEGQGAEETVFRDVMDGIPASLLPMVRMLLQRLGDAPSLAQLARLMGQSPRTLQRAAVSARCCSPSDLICAVRVLVASRLLAGERHAMPVVLARTGFESTRALRHAMQRCGLDSPGGHRASEDYAAARAAVLRFIAARNRIRVTWERPAVRAVHNEDVVSQSGPNVTGRELAGAPGKVYDRSDGERARLGQ